MKRNWMVLLILGVFGAVLVPGIVHAAILAHDVTATTGTQEGNCADCHNTTPAAATRGWGRSLSGAPSSGWGTRAITALCWSCHASGNSVGAHDVSGTAMGVGSHAYVNSAVPPQPGNGNLLDNAAVVASGLPYAAAGNLQCTSCHNVHNAANRPFNIKTTVRALCNSCHPGRDRALVGALNTGGTPAYSTHPVGVTIANLAGNGPTGFLGTISDNMTTPWGTVGVGTSTIALGGKLEQTTTNLSCETCHAVHGPRTGGPGVQDLLATNNQSEGNATSSYLCTGCHTGGLAGGMVSGILTAGDHPVDNNLLRPFYPSGTTALPTAWTTLAPRLDRGAAGFTAAATGQPRCSSCHDAHSGYATTSLLKGPSTPTGAAPTMMGTGGWCEACHTLTGAVPNLHHSTTPVLATSLIDCGGCHGVSGAYWTAHNGFDGFKVGPENADGTAGTGGLTSALNSRTFERLCERCHNPTNPTYAATGSPVGTPGSVLGTLPSRHGVSTGTQTHLTSDLTNSIGVWDADRTFNSYLRAGTTAADNSWGNTSASNLPPAYTSQPIYSKYANYGAGTPSNPADISASAYLICESCHNLVLNAGVPTTATDKTQGYLANLLVRPYADDGQGPTNTVSSGHTAGTTVGDGLCRGCHASQVIPFANLDAPTVAQAYVHYPEAHTTNQALFTYGITPYGRTTNTVLTAYAIGSCPNTSTGDAGGAPGLFTYPAANRMNCDSCHRPHNADANGNNGLTALSNTAEWYALEDGTVATDNRAKTEACTQCHNNRATTNWGCIQ